MLFIVDLFKFCDNGSICISYFVQFCKSDKRENTLEYVLVGYVDISLEHYKDLIQQAVTYCQTPITV